MILRSFVALLLVTSLAIARPTTAPATQPAETPATTRAGFPTAAELAEKIKAMQAQAEATPKFAYFDLNESVLEKPRDFSFFGSDTGLTLRDLLDRIDMAIEDEDVDGLLVHLRTTSFNLAQAQEIRRALVRAREADKRVFVYADAYDTTAYVMASGASDICMLEGGEIMIPGIGIETMFAKGLLDKIGVHADYVQIGEYKGADEQFTRTGPSDELREEMNKISDALYNQIIDGIAAARALPRDRVAAAVDEALITGPRAKELGLVDHLVDIDGIRELIQRELAIEELTLLSDYGAPGRETIDFTNLFALLAQLSKRPQVSDEPAIAIVYAEGMIIDGEGGEGLFSDGGTVGSEDIRRAMRLVGRDENIKGVVLRIDSPGGSALASEAMWQAVRRVAAEKPVVVSIGSMAASGGYYLASAADHIIADPSAIVGSIGVVGGKFVLKDLYGKIGLTTETFARGANADLFSSSSPFTEKQRQLVTQWMQNTYQQFTGRILQTRKDRIPDIDKVARGRIFLAQQAKEFGMVDQIGGIQEAIAYVAEKADLVEGEYDVRTVPAPMTFADLVNGRNDVTAPMRPRVQVAEDSILRALSPKLRQMLGQQLQAIQLLQQKPVILVTPYVISVK